MPSRRCERGEHTFANEPPWCLGCGESMESVDERLLAAAIEANRKWVETHGMED